MAENLLSNSFPPGVTPHFSGRSEQLRQDELVELVSAPGLEEMLPLYSLTGLQLPAPWLKRLKKSWMRNLKNPHGWEHPEPGELENVPLLVGFFCSMRCTASSPVA